MLGVEPVTRYARENIIYLLIQEIMNTRTNINLLRYVEWEYGKYPRVERAFTPIHYMQCEDPICIKICPVDAITQTEEGIIQINKDKR